MLASRSARLAATLLLALLFGWTIRAYRKGATTATSPAASSVTTPVNETPKTAFPDE